MSALLDQPTIKRDRTDSDAPRAKLSNLPYGTDESSVRSFVVSTNVAVTSLLVKNNGRVAIATLPDDAALDARRGGLTGTPRHPHDGPNNTFIAIRTRNAQEDEGGVIAWYPAKHAESHEARVPMDEVHPPPSSSTSHKPSVLAAKSSSYTTFIKFSNSSIIR